MSRSISAKVGILIGGKSRRFGSPKWEAKIGGLTILERVWEACSDFEERVVIGKKRPPRFNKPFLSDQTDAQSPIFGLYALLKNSNHEWNFLLSCDLPLLTKEVLRKVWEKRNDKVDIIIPKANGRIQVTCALYNKKLEKPVSQIIQEGSLSLRSLAEKRTFRKINIFR